MAEQLIPEDKTTQQLEEQLAEYDEDDLKEIMKSGGAELGYPLPPAKESIFKFFRQIIKLKDSSKVGNVHDTELGRLPLTVRLYQDLALYAQQEKMNKVSDYLKAKSEIMLATSLSRKGFLAQLFVTQIKSEKKAAAAPQQKSSWWNKNKPAPPEGGIEP